MKRESGFSPLCCEGIGLERLKMKVFKDVVGLFGGASGKGNGVKVRVCVGNEMKDSFSFENLGETAKLSD